MPFLSLRNSPQNLAFFLVNLMVNYPINHCFFTVFPLSVKITGPIQIHCQKFEQSILEPI